MAVVGRHSGRAGRNGMRRRSAAVLSLGACLALAAAWSNSVAAYSAPASGARPVTARATDAESADALRRREVFMALAGGASAVTTPTGALAEEAALTAPASKIQRAVINVGDKEALKKEVKFWTEGCLMQKLSEGPGADGKTSAVVGYGPEGAGKDGFFGIEIKVDPEVLTRPTPRLLNYQVMQPTVPALGFVQITANGKVIDLFSRVQNSGGSALFGDATYLDVESPRGVAVRLVPREEKPSVELLSLNVEVPAFEPTVKFYRRVLGMQDEKYPESDPPVQKLSALLTSEAGGAKLLLSPVPDGRLKERSLDEFEGMLVVTPSGPDGTLKVAQQAVQLAEQESQQKDEDLASKLRQAESGSSGAKERSELKAAIRARATGTTAKPEIDGMNINDGVGNIFTLAGPSEFAKMA